MKRIVSRCLVALALLLVIASGASAALAQDATPIAGTCDAPELPPGTPTPMEDMEMGGPPADDATPTGGDATPTGDDAGPPMAEASPMPEGTPADAATAERVTAAIANPIACYNAGDYLGVGALFTPAGLMDEFGTANPYDLDFFLSGGPPLALLAVDDVQVLDDGRFSADVLSSFGGTQLNRERWLLVESGDYLLVDATPDLAVEAPEGAVTIEVAMVDYAFELSSTTAPANTPLVFDVTNTGEYPHEVVIAQLPEGMTAEQLLDEATNFEEVMFIGFTFSEGGEPAPDLVLTGLEAGTYTLVCFIDIPDGIPHVARGMVAELVVE
ncbi:MAG: hypothetical protein M3509_08265 [Chloroflexota bacterium]|nr:hypothetical protein [Chloroflexota bacterium]